MRDFIIKCIEHGVYTHAGTFHADDVLSIIFIQMMAYSIGEKENVKVKRIMKVEEADDPEGVFVDIGLGQFDHHQQDAKLRNADDPKSKYAAFGLLWKRFGVEYIQSINRNINNTDAQLIADRIDYEFVSGMDKTDNFGQNTCWNPLVWLISAYNSHVNFEDLTNEGEGLFYDVISLAFLMKIKIYNAELKLLNKRYKTGSKILVLEPDDGNLSPYFVKNLGVIMIVHRSLRGGFAVNSVNSGMYPVKAEQGKSGCRFIHATKFIATFETLDQAIACAENSV